MTVHLINSLIIKKKDKYPIVSTNDKITDKNNISEEISSHRNSAEIIDHKCDDNEINSVNKE